MKIFDRFSFRNISALTESQEADFQSKKMTAVTRLLVLTQPVNILNALLISYLFIDKVDNSVLALLVSLVSISCLSWLGWSYSSWLKLDKKLSRNIH